MIGQRNKLLKSGEMHKAQCLDVEIAKTISGDNRRKAFMFKKYINKGETKPVSEMWKLKQSLFPKKTSTLPSSKFNHRGRLISEPLELVKLLGMEYGKVRLRKRSVHPMHKNLKPMREKLLALKLSLALKNKTPKILMVLQKQFLNHPS